MEEQSTIKQLGSELEIKINGYPVSIGQIERNGKGVYINLGAWIKFEENGVDTNEVQLRKFKSGLYKWSQTCQIELFPNIILNRSIRDCEIGMHCFNTYVFMNYEITLFFTENVSLKDITLLKHIELYADLIYSYIEDGSFVNIKQSRKS